MTQLNSKNNALQVLRAIIFVMIIMFHCHIPYSQFFWIGVEIFFCISGYFTFKKLLNYQENSLWEVVKNRISRLYYPQYLCLITFFSFLVMIVLGEFKIHKTLYYFLGIQNFAVRELLLDDNACMIHTWTIAVEMQTILIVALLVWIFDHLKINRRFVLITMASIAVLYEVTIPYIFHNSMLYSVVPISHLFSFAIGGAVNLFQKSKEHKKIAVGMISLGVITIIIICIALADKLQVSWVQAWLTIDSSTFDVLQGRYMSLVYPACGLIGGGVLDLCLSIPNEKCKCKSLINMGNHSFTLYLVHFPIVSTFFLFINNVWIVFFLSISLTILFSYFWDSVLEKGHKKTNKVD